MPRAFTRAVSPRLADCELTHQSRVPIDAAKAAEQHAAYEEALRDAGYEVIRLPELPDHPDAVFVEDTAILLGDHAVITRPGAESRRGEIESTAAGLAPFFNIHRIERGYLDGGDVLQIGKRVYVGLSTRTDQQGIDALAEIAGPLGYDVIRAQLGDCLHLKTGTTVAGDNILLHIPGAIDPAQFEGVEPLAVAAGEEAAANCVNLGSRLIIHAGNPTVVSALRERGLTVVEVAVGELEKAEAGVTCMSLIDSR
jgi:dimethylargininase